MTTEKKIELSKIMKQAWMIIKTESVSKSEALKRAWVIVKNPLKLENNKAINKSAKEIIEQNKIQVEVLKNPRANIEDPDYGETILKLVPEYIKPINKLKLQHSWVDGRSKKVLENWIEKIISPAKVSNETKQKATAMLEYLAMYNDQYIIKINKIIQASGLETGGRESGVQALVELYHDPIFLQYLDFEAYVLQCEEQKMIKKEEQKIKEQQEATKYIKEWHMNADEASEKAKHMLKHNIAYMSQEKMHSL